MKLGNVSAVWGMLLVCSPLCLSAVAQGSIDSWVDFESRVATSQVIASFSSPDAARGAVFASPSRDNPPYFRHWVRDGALVMNTALDLLERGPASEREHLMRALLDYVQFSRGNQLTTNPSGTPADGALGEPWFHMDGSAYWGGWRRPQNDGPALRAITLTRLANLLLDQGQEGYVRGLLYNGRIPAETVIKADLEYVSHVWQYPSVDLWEEVKGFHFYTRIVQRRALIEGAKLARRLGDWGGADFYQQSADRLSLDTHSHWRPELGYLLTTFERLEGIDYKTSGLDVSVLLGSLHADSASDRFLSPADPRIQATAQRLREAFARQYGINGKTTDFEGNKLGPAMGRYPEDLYNGYDSTGPGNPWFLTTHALAEIYYRSAREYALDRRIPITAENLDFFRALRSSPVSAPGITPAFAPFRTLGVGTLTAGQPGFAMLLQALHDEGDSFLARSRAHGSLDGHFSEQMGRDSGFMQGASDLTWSYASFLSAAWAR
jgi:glucoamylase